MADFPDYTRLFHLVGTEITIPINIEASDVTLPVSIVAVTADLDVTIVASDVTLPISIDAATVTIDVSIVAQVGNITFEFADQSVAVFDASKWFAHEAQQQFVSGQATIADDSCAVVCLRGPTAGERMFVVGFGYGLISVLAPPTQMMAMLRIETVITASHGSIVGGGLSLDTPLRVEPDETVDLYVCQYGSGGNNGIRGSFWGYYEAV